MDVTARGRSVFRLAGVLCVAVLLAAGCSLRRVATVPGIERSALASEAEPAAAPVAGMPDRPEPKNGHSVPALPAMAGVPGNDAAAAVEPGARNDAPAPKSSRPEIPGMFAGTTPPARVPAVPVPGVVAAPAPPAAPPEPALTVDLPAEPVDDTGIEPVPAETPFTADLPAAPVEETAIETIPAEPVLADPALALAAPPEPADDAAAPPVLTAPPPSIPPRRRTVAVTASGFSAEITIEPDCVVEITVDEDPSLNGSYAVDRDGGIDFGYVGLVVLQGATAGEAQRKIRTILERRYFRSASVGVRITKASYDKIQVSGAVAIPGMVKIGSGAVISLEEALVRAGGILPEAKEMRIKIVPGGAHSVFGAASPDGQMVRLSIEEGDARVPDVQLRNRDLVHVFADDPGESARPGDKEIMVLGEVPREGVIRFGRNEPCTLLHLIFKMGGLPQFAKARGIKIKRTGDDGKEQEIRANAVRLLKTGDPDLDVPLRHGDRVIIPSRTIGIF